jgi:hypothetical protein
MQLTNAVLDNLLLVLAVVVVFAMVLERAAVVLFEWSLWNQLREKWPIGLNTPVAFIFALLICWHTQFDALLQVFPQNGKTWVGFWSVGTFVTAGVIAGGSKGAIRLFQGILGFGKEAVDARVQLNKAISGAQVDSRPRLPR